MQPIVLPTFTCNRCGYTWIPKVPLPKRCAKCRTPYWNSPRKNKVRKIKEGIWPEKE